MVGNFFVTAARAALILALVFSLAGCVSDRDSRRTPARRAITSLAGEATLLDGALLAEVRFGPLQLDGEERTGGIKLPGNLHGDARIAGHNGDLRPSGGLGFSMGGGGRGERHASAPAAGGGRRGGANAAGASAPLAQITLRFTNRSPAPLQFRVAEFRSLLGNFVVSPAVFELAPGASLDAAPLATQLGADLVGVDLQLEVKTATGAHRTVVELRPGPAAQAR